MISLLRIDNRLIHGQIAVAWTKYLGVNRILVANDIICTNEVQKSTLKMACPSTAKCSVVSVDGAIQILLDPRAKGLKILIIVNNPKDAHRIAKAVPDVPYINISNYGSLEQDLSGRLKVADTVYLTEDDLKDFAEIRALGKRCEYQLVPDNRSKDLYELIEKAKKAV